MEVKVTDEVTSDVVSILYTGLMTVNTFPDAQTVYNLYKAGKITTLGLYKNDVQVLELLAKLGFPMNHPGTFLFKDLVLKILYTTNSEDKDERGKVIMALSDSFSDFYFDLARNDLDLGIKSFHEFINDAFDNIDGNKADPDVLSLFEGTYEQNDVTSLAMGVCDYCRIGVQKSALGL